MTTSFYTATSLDGFIATTEHSLDWLLSQDFDQSGPMNYTTFLESTGALAMGSSSYEWLLRNDPNGWSYELPAWVFTHRELPRPDGADIRFVSGEVAAAHTQMRDAAGEKGIWVLGGGELAGQFADAGLLDEVWVQYAPVTLGAGAPLLPRRLDLELIETAQNRGFLCGRYRVVKSP